MEYTKSERLSGVLAFLDFEKAFDSVDWDFVHTCLEAFNFSSDFKEWVSMLYKVIFPAAFVIIVGSQIFLNMKEAFVKVIHYLHIFLSSQ